MNVMAIQLRPLSEDRFLETFSPPMQDITTSAEEIMDLWAYTEAVPSSEFSGRDTRDWNVACIYRDSANTWQHVLIGTDVPDAFVVIVIDVARKELVGHHFLNLRQKYGLGQ